MRKPKVLIKAAPKVTKFTIESICKYLLGNQMNLIDNIFLYPNFGVGFKVFMKRRPQDYYIVDHVRVKNNQHGKIFGLFHKNGVADNKINHIRRTLQNGRWGYELPEGKFYTENGIEFDIKHLEQLKEEKTKLLVKRNEMIGYVPFPKLQNQAQKKAKMEALAKKKK